MSTHRHPPGQDPRPGGELHQPVTGATTLVLCSMELEALETCGTTLRRLCQPRRYIPTEVLTEIRRARTALVRAAWAYRTHVQELQDGTGLRVLQSGGAKPCP